MNEKIVIASVAKFIALARATPALLSIGSLSLLKSATLAQTSNTAPGKGCACNKKVGGMDISVLRPQFEAAMTMLTPAEMNTMKTVLSAKTICYYVKNNVGQLKQTCF